MPDVQDDALPFYWLQQVIGGGDNGVALIESRTADTTIDPNIPNGGFDLYASGEFVWYGTIGRPQAGAVGLSAPPGSHTLFLNGHLSVGGLTSGAALDVRDYSVAGAPIATFGWHDYVAVADKTFATYTSTSSSTENGYADYYGSLNVHKANDTGVTFFRVSATSGRLELQDDYNAILYKDHAGNTKWLAGTRIDVSNVNDYHLYGYAGGFVRFWQGGSEYTRFDPASGLYALKGLWVGENTGAWGFRGMKSNATNTSAIQLINSRGANPYPWIDFKAAEAGDAQQTFRVDVSQESVSLGHAILMGNAGANVLGLSDIPAALGGNPTSGGYLYANAGKLFWRGSAGTVTQIAAA